MSPEDQDTHETVLETWELEKEALEIYLASEQFYPLAWCLIKRAEEDLASDLENLPPYILPGESESHLQELKEIATRVYPKWEADYQAWFQKGLIESAMS